MRLRSLHLALVVLSLVNCKSKRVDDQPADLVTRDDLLKEQKRIDNGETVGQALQAPKVVVDAQQVSINGSRVSPRTDLESGGKIKKVETVFAWAKGLKEHWKSIHPSQDFVPGADVTLPDDIAFADGASVIMTLAFAGYPNAMVVRAGDATAVINVSVPPPPKPDDAPDDPVPPPVVELWNASGGWGERLTNPGRANAGKDASEFGMHGVFGDPNASTSPWGGGLAAPIGGAPPLAVDCPASRAVTLSTLAEALKADCGGACGGFVIGGTPKFHDALVMAAAALHPVGGIIPPHQTIAFQVDPVCGTTTAALPSSTSSFRPFNQGWGVADAPKLPAVILGETTVTGSLPPEVIQRITRQNSGRFRLCYENGLRTNPKLAGKVSVKFVIDRAGVVSVASDGGSDLPDQAVVQCVVRGFRTLSFPQPENGIVTVVYPITFSP